MRFILFTGELEERKKLLFVCCVSVSESVCATIVMCNILAQIYNYGWHWSSISPLLNSSEMCRAQQMRDCVCSMNMILCLFVIRDRVKWRIQQQIAVELTAVACLYSFSHLTQWAVSRVTQPNCHWRKAKLNSIFKFMSLKLSETKWKHASYIPFEISFDVTTRP